MKLFFKKTILFFIFLYGSIITILLISNYFINSVADFKLKPNVNKIIIGNSQPECAFNDSLISNFKNLANAGESYFYGYQKLKAVLDQNPQVDTVYVEFNPTTILTREDDKIWEDRFIKHQVPNNLAFFDFDDHKLLATHNAIGYQQAVLKGVKTNLKRIELNQYNFVDSIGGYRHIKWSHTKAILDTLEYNPQIQYGINQKSVSKYDGSYLKKMVNLCENKEIKIIFVRSPYHEKFIGRKYENIFQKYRRDNFGTIEFLDYKDFPIEENEFGDLQHLNYLGAKKFSMWFDKHID